MTRLGVVVPSVNTVIEPWYSQAVPPGVTVHAARMLLADDLSAAAIVDMDRSDGMRAVEHLASCRVAAVAYCCTASSIVQGSAYDAELVREVERVARAPATTVTAAILAACAELGVSRVAIGSPYAGDIHDAEAAFFDAAGLEVLASEGLGIADSFSLAVPGPDEIAALAESVWDPGAEALLLTCANFRSHEVIAQLEAQLDRPVVTATQATLWRLLDLAGVRVPIAGYGRLFSAGA